jgi:hypothetical protein
MRKLFHWHYVFTQIWYLEQESNGLFQKLLPVCDEFMRRDEIRWFDGTGRIQGFSFYFCLMIEGSGSVPQTHTIGPGSGRLKKYGFGSATWIVNNKCESSLQETYLEECLAKLSVSGIITLGLQPTVFCQQGILCSLFVSFSALILFCTLPYQFTLGF